MGADTEKRAMKNKEFILLTFVDAGRPEREA